MHRIQVKILEALKKHGGVLKDFSFRVLGEMVGVDHPQQAKHHLSQLEKRGLVIFDKASQLLKLTSLKTPTRSAIVTIPIIGAASCGQTTLFAQEEVEGTLKISRKLIPNRDKNVFAIRAVGNSMNRANIGGLSIEEGDYVLVDGNDRNARPGQYVLAVVDDFGVVKKFMRGRRPGEYELISESTEEHPPIQIHHDDRQLIISGRVIHIIKKPKTNWSN